MHAVGEAGMGIGHELRTVARGLVPRRVAGLHTAGGLGAAPPSSISIHQTTIERGRRGTSPRATDGRRDAESQPPGGPLAGRGVARGQRVVALPRWSPLLTALL